MKRSRETSPQLSLCHPTATAFGGCGKKKRGSSAECRPRGPPGDPTTILPLQRCHNSHYYPPYFTFFTPVHSNCSKASSVSYALRMDRNPPFPPSFCKFGNRYCFYPQNTLNFPETSKSTIVSKTVIKYSKNS